MKNLTKIGIHSLIISLLMFSVSTNVLAAADTLENTQESIERVMVKDEFQESVILYADELAEEVMAEIPNDTEVELVDEGPEYSFIHYTPEDSNEQLLQGFIMTSMLVKQDIASENASIEVEESTSIGESNIQEEASIVDSESANPVESEAIAETTPALSQPPTDQKLEEDQEDDDTIISSEPQDVNEKPSIKTEEAVSDKDKTSNHEIATFALSVPAPVQFSGVALKNHTHVYEQSSTKSTIVKSYKQGHILKFQSYSKDYYLAYVIINGQKKTGYIHVNDVDKIGEQKNLQGIAIKNVIDVYQSPTKDAKVLKSYKLYQSLKYQSFSSQWHKATVFVNGKKEVGYIHAEDVKQTNVKGDSQHDDSSVVVPSVQGVAMADKTVVYSSTSTSSEKLKMYAKGHILKYRYFNENWYEATVYVNGKAHTGYIYMKDVETADPTPASLKGIASQATIHVYSKAATNSKVLKSYKKGHILKYQSFTSDWYKATVIINGKRQTGYIHKSHTEEITNKPVNTKGFALQASTKVYSSPLVGSKVLKSYKYGQGLKFKTFSTNWYEATVYVNGKPHTGYIHKNDVRLVSGKLVVIDAGHGGHDPGSQGIGFTEKWLNLDISLRAKALLENAGFSVLMTRSTDVYVSLQDRAAIANNAKADIFISVHANVFNQKAKGIETYWYGKYEKENSKRLATALQKNVIKNMNTTNRGVKEGNFHVIRETKMPSSLVEVGFIDNAEDAAKLRQAKYRQIVAEGILHGVMDYYK